MGVVEPNAANQPTEKRVAVFGSAGFALLGDLASDSTTIPTETLIQFTPWIYTEFISHLSTNICFVAYLVTWPTKVILILGASRTLVSIVGVA